MPNYTDYQLYQILENNGYKPNAENLKSLKEGIESGSMVFGNIDEEVAAYLNSIPECAGMDESAISDMVYHKRAG